MSLKETLKGDIRFRKRMKHILELNSNCESWVAQLESIHVSRDITALNSNKLLSDSKRITIDSNVDNQAARSRCVTIRLKAMRQLLVIEEALDTLQKYVYNRYAEELKPYKTLTDKKSAVAFVLQGPTKRLKQLKFVIEFADIIIADVDAAGFSIKRVNDTLALNARDH